MPIRHFTACFYHVFSPRSQCTWQTLLRYSDPVKPCHLNCFRTLTFNRAFTSNLKRCKQSSQKSGYPSAASPRPLNDNIKLSVRSDANFDTLGSWNNRLDLDVDITQSLKSGKLVPSISVDNVGTASLTGRRQVNEDRLSVMQLSEQVLMFAIFDGHGGHLAADYAAEHMHAHVTRGLERQTDLHAVLTTAFRDLNTDFVRHVYYNFLGCESAMNAGTTATVCLLRHNNELVVGYVGDSKALMCRRGKVVRLSEDHNPDDNPREIRRVTAAGGVITASSVGGRSRVNARLNMTRSLGDLDLKPAGVIAEPDTRSIEVKHGKDAFLVLSTDGVSGVISDQEVVDIVSTCPTAPEAAQFVAHQALSFGSEDNATVAVVPFGAWGKYGNTARTAAFSFGRSVVGARYA